MIQVYPGVVEQEAKHLRKGSREKERKKESGKKESSNLPERKERYCRAEEGINNG
jgi:hypothetical protein